MTSVKLTHNQLYSLLIMQGVGLTAVVLKVYLTSEGFIYYSKVAENVTVGFFFFCKNMQFCNYNIHRFWDLPLNGVLSWTT